MSKGYKITRSNYTLKKRVQTVSGGVVYERDFMTTTNLGGWDSGAIPFGENNFKMYYRDISNAKKHPYHGEWLKNDCSDTPEIWTEECVPSSGTSEEEQIKIKPNFNSLLDFAYYGSCTELVKSTVVNIIKNFPAEMYVVGGDEHGLRRSGILKANENLIANNFDINLTDSIVPEGSNADRYFLKSYVNYNAVIGNGSASINQVSLVSNDRCGNFILDIYVDGYGKGSISGQTYESRVRLIKTNFPVGTRFFPSSKKIDEFFEGLDDFSSVVLNVNTNPIYSMVLDTPQETEKGVETYRITYTWPTENGWNLQIEGDRFQKYINGLLSISEFYDEYYTNNLWRMLTHDSIKAMDVAFADTGKNEDTEDYNIGTTRLEGLFWAIGRQFDEIKRSIDNIKNTSKVSYDGNNNLPDYFLTDILNLGGWEIRNIDETLSKNEKTAQIFTGITSGFSAKDANNEFLKRLRLTSTEILSKKGTRNGIESLLNLFGLLSYDMWRLLPVDANNKPWYDFKIDEYVAAVKESEYAVSTELEEPFKLETANLLKQSISVDTPEGAERDTLEGIPCQIKYVETNYGIYKYIVPWFDKSKTYDGDLYFQSRGGWGSHESEASGYDWDRLKFSGVGYDETVKYIIIVEKLPDLRNIPVSKLYNGAIAYVNDITSYLDELPTGYDLSSNYFELKNIENRYTISNEGWKNIPIEEIEERTSLVAKKIYYIEHLVENFLSNNPHVGYGKYDFGKEYIEYLENPLKYSIDKDNYEDEQMFYEDAYDCNGNLIFNNNTFLIEDEVQDNMKCWYFNPLGEKRNNVKVLTKNGNLSYYSQDDVELSFFNVEDTTYESDVFTFDFIEQDTGHTANEITCDSIINTKILKITFYIEKARKEEFIEFVNTTIMPYLIQMLPSDVIFTYNVEERNVESASISSTTPGAEVNDVNAVIGDREINDDFITGLPTDNDADNYIININENS